MHRFYLPPEQPKGTSLLLSGSEAHHALDVLRVERGERVLVLDGAGREFDCQVQACERATVRLAVQGERMAEPPPARLTLLQAVPKGKIIESIIQKATELGAAQIVPLLTERVATRLDEREAARKAIKWQAIAIEAIKQSGNAWLPKVETPVTPAEFLARREVFDLPLIASLQGESRHPRECFAEFRHKHGRQPGSICIWIGPEGDFTSAEVGAVKAAGALPITLGPLVLRTETAAIYCLSALNYELTSPASCPRITGT